MPLWSHSRIQAFEQCPRRYAFRYVEKPDIEKIDSIEAFLGTRVHETLEQLYRDVRMHKPVSRTELLNDFERRWRKHFHDDIRIVRTRYSADNYFAVACRCLEDYYRRYRPFGQSRTLGLEERIVINLDLRGDYRLQGYIDRLALVDDGHYEVHDYKTSNSLPSQERVDADRQLALYQIGVERRFGDALRVDLVWHYLQFDREIRSRREPHQLDQLRFDTIGMIQDIERQVQQGEFPTRESALCDWCEYMPVCPIKKHLHRVQELSPEDFHADDGVQLVQAWVAETVRRRDAIRRSADELDRLRDAIVAYARKHELEVIAGVDHKLRVNVHTGLKVPTKSEYPVAMEALKTKLQTMGRWEAVATLDRHALQRLLDSDELSADERRVLEEELVPDRSAQIYVSRLSERERERTPGEI
jgi:putative RecB family exonuclease